MFPNQIHTHTQTHKPCSTHNERLSIVGRRWKFRFHPLSAHRHRTPYVFIFTTPFFRIEINFTRCRTDKNTNKRQNRQQQQRDGIEEHLREALLLDILCKQKRKSQWALSQSRAQQYCRYTKKKPPHILDQSQFWCESWYDTRIGHVARIVWKHDGRLVNCECMCISLAVFM